MNKPLAITAFLDAQTMATVEQLASAQGRSIEDFAAEAIRRAAEHDADLTAFAQVGLDDIEAGRFHTQEQMRDWFAERIGAAEARAAQVERPA